MKNSIYLLYILVLCSCSTIHKTRTSNNIQQVHLDTSSNLHEYIRETTVTEQGTTQIITRPDTTGIFGWLSVQDTTGYSREIETGGQRVKTTIMPRIKEGKTIGYDISTAAVKKSEIINVPVDRKTVTKESSTDNEKSGITDTQAENIATTNKQVISFNLAGIIAVVVSVVVVTALILLFIYFKRKK